MSSSISELTTKAEITGHLNFIMDMLGDYVVGVEDISRLMYEVEGDLCSIFGTNKDGDKFFLYRCAVSDLTEDTGLYTPISTSISDPNRVSARKASAVAQKLFRNFQKGLSCSSSTLTPSYSLEHGATAEGAAFCHSAKLIGKLNIEGIEYKITFGQLINFEHKKNGASQMARAIEIAENWGKDLTLSSFKGRLNVAAEGVTITRTNGLPIIQLQQEDTRNDEAIARKLQQAEFTQNELPFFNVFQQRKPQSLSGKPKVEEIKVNIKDVKNLAEANLAEAMALLEKIVLSTNPYKNRTGKEVYAGLKKSTVSETLGKRNPLETDARKWSHKISFGDCYWMIPVVDEKGVPLTVELILDQLRAIAYFGPEINDLLVHWVKREVYLSTEFAMDTVKDKDGVESKKRVCTIGMFKVHQLPCIDLSVLTQQPDGDFKARIDLPDDIYSLKPDELIAGIQQNISLFIEHTLKATDCCQVEGAKGSDVQTMVRALHDVLFDEELEKLGAQLYWKFLTLPPDYKPNSLKLYIDLQDEKNRVAVYSLFRDFLEKFDPTKNWSFTIHSEAVNTVREWRKNEAAIIRDPVPPLCIQMTWNKLIDEKIVSIVECIDEFEPRLRKYGIVSREVVNDGLSDYVIVELNVHGVEKRSKGKVLLEKFLTVACRKFIPKCIEEGAWITQKLDSSVKMHGYKIFKPNTLKYAIRRVTGPEGEMIRFIQESVVPAENEFKSNITNDITKNSLPKANSQVLNKENVKSSTGILVQEYEKIDDLKISMNNKQIILEVNAPNAKEKEALIDSLSVLMGEAAKLLTDQAWLYDSIVTPFNRVEFVVEKYQEPGFVELLSDFGGLASAIGGFSIAPGFGKSQPQPQATQYDPGFDIGAIFDVIDEDL